MVLPWHSYFYNWNEHSKSIQLFLSISRMTIYDIINSAAGSIKPNGYGNVKMK